MSGKIIYYSTYGSTQRYAEALAELLGWEALPYKQAKKAQIAELDTVVLASNIRVGKMGIRKWAKRHAELLKKKKVLVLAVGGEVPDNQKYYYDAAVKSLGFLDLKQAQVAGLGGRKIRAELNRMDTFLFNSLDKMIKDPAAKEDILKDVDLVDMSLLTGVAERLK